jgi:hypothetical protein
MSAPIILEVLKYIVDRIRERDGIPTRTKVVKILYLIDVEYHRRHGSTLSQLPWKFLHYGPYTMEIEPLFQSISLGEEEIVVKDRHRVFTYKVEQPEALDSLLPFSDRMMIEKIIDRWALESLYKLLDYVYFETEPMQGAARGELLDFSTITREPLAIEETPQAHLPKETINRFREKFKAIHAGKAHAGHHTPPPYDDIYFQAIATMNSGETGPSTLRFMKNVEIVEESEHLIDKQSE